MPIKQSLAQTTVAWLISPLEYADINASLLASSATSDLILHGVCKLAAVVKFWIPELDRQGSVVSRSTELHHLADNKA
ncbi:hypothetical protein BV898_19079 [Hypsibius exemplaris]|uniref:Uncharacterized protein n=1 Tax=Hypsibius exemplaris TaxID=2072580 RepID=A0A9X6RP35_HYPEX|nr:hypothetical protein BV898_19079 [Hypsibius exemplaris]